MKSLICAFVIFVIIVSCKQKKENTSSKENTIETVNEKSEEWIVLFDGSSFENWRGYLSNSMYSEWSIEDGAMVLSPGEIGSKNLVTKEKYTNFILSLDWKISEGGNSGFFWGVNEDDKLPEAYQTGPEIQLIDNERHPDAFVNPKFHQSGALYDMVEPMHDVCNPAGEWNECVLEIDHNKNYGKVILNGTLVAEFPVHGEEWDKLVSNSKFKDWEHFGKYQTGYIGLQDHGNKVWFRNIKIKKL